MKAKILGTAVSFESVRLAYYLLDEIGPNKNQVSWCLIDLAI